MPGPNDWMDDVLGEPEEGEEVTQPDESEEEEKEKEDPDEGDDPGRSSDDDEEGSEDSEEGAEEDEEDEEEPEETDEPDEEPGDEEQPEQPSAIDITKYDSFQMDDGSVITREELQQDRQMAGLYDTFLSNLQANPVGTLENALTVMADTAKEEGVTFDIDAIIHEIASKRGWTLYDDTEGIPYEPDPTLPEKQKMERMERELQSYKSREAQQVESQKMAAAQQRELNQLVSETGVAYGPEQRKNPNHIITRALKESAETGLPLRRTYTLLVAEAERRRAKSGEQENEREQKNDGNRKNTHPVPKKRSISDDIIDGRV